MSYLQEVKEKVIRDLLENQSKIDINSKMIKAFKGNLDPLYYEAIKTVSIPQHRIDLDTHKTHINPYKKAIAKLSQNYSYKVKRNFLDANGKEVFDFYDSKTLNKSFLEINSFANVNQYAVGKLKFNKKKGEIEIVPISADKFWLYTDNEYNSTQPTVYVEFIKNLLTPELKKTGVEFAQSFYLYTDTERLEIQATMSRGKLGIEDISESSVNPLGFAPFILLRYDSSQLIPETNTADVSFAQRIPVLYTEIAIALHYLSNPIPIFKNISQKNSKLAIDPSSAIVLNAEAGSTLQPEFTFVSPNLDISQGMSFIAELVSDFLFSKDVSVKKEGVVDMSGLAMLIEGGETLEARKAQMPYLDEMEQEYWNKLALFHNYLLTSEDRDLYKAPKVLCSTDIWVDIEYQSPSSAQEQIQDTNNQKETEIETAEE